MPDYYRGHNMRAIMIIPRYIIIVFSHLQIIDEFVFYTFKLKNIIYNIFR